MKVAIVNDTSPSGHFGCILGMEVLYTELVMRDMEFIGSVVYNERINHDLLKKADLVIVNGEGSLHHGKRQELINIANGYPSVLINAVYQDNTPNKALKKFKYISVRESLSQAALKEQGVESEIVPDLVFASDTLREYKHTPTKGLGIVDSIDTAGNGLYARSPNFLDKLVQYSQVCTGRFHGIVACAVLGIPFSAYGSNTHKNQALMTDLKRLISYKDNLDDALLSIPKTNYRDESVRQYVSEAPSRIGKMFDKICVQ